MIRLFFVASRSDSKMNIIGRRTRKNEVQAAAGLNWGYSNALPKLGDCYIPIQGSTVESLEIGEKNNEYYECIFDDGFRCNIRLEGNGPYKDGIQYPKQISAYQDKNLLGQYFRRRIGNRIGRNLVFSDYAIERVNRIKNENRGDSESIRNQIRRDSRLLMELEEKFITSDDLELYGRTYVEVSVDQFGSYHMNFN